MSACAVYRFPMRDPDDMSGLAGLLDQGKIAASDIKAVFCKTEGNGLNNDWTRHFVDRAVRDTIAARGGDDAETLRRKVLVLISGGSEGVVSPHMLVLVAVPTAGTEPGLALGMDIRDLAPADLARRAHSAVTADMARAAMKAAGARDASQVGFVVVRAPGDAAQGASSPRVRAAVSLGVAQALGEIAGEIDEAAFLKDFSKFCGRVFVVARDDTTTQQVSVLANAPGGTKGLGVAARTLRDPLDSPGVAAVLAKLGIAAAPQASPDASSRIVASLSKGDPPGDGFIRGARHTMNSDSDIHEHRHGRSAYGAMIASVIGHSFCFVSGGAEHHGPEDGGLIALIARDEGFSA
ncbi:MAG: cyanuric acid amidohydrolase [Alphaproteobacteria bacterium]|nr:cyanuric acid amidohydrolase [Alphaproteobacteria bacterium]